MEIRKKHPRHPSQHNCSSEHEPAPDGYIDNQSGCPHTEETFGEALTQCSVHPGEKPFLVCDFHMHSHLQMRIFAANVRVRKSRELKGAPCDDCFNDLYEDNPPSSHCFYELEDLASEDICIACFDQAVSDYESQCSNRDPKSRKSFRCPRYHRGTPRKDDAKAYPLQRREAFWKGDGWRPRSGCWPYLDELSYCAKCDGLLTSWLDTDMCTEPKAACNCDWHKLYRYIRAEREPHPPMLPIENVRELHRPPNRKNKNGSKNKKT